MSPAPAASSLAYLLLAGAGALLGLVLLAWGWRGAPARGRPRCPKCWYDLTGLPEPRCPECGHRVTRDRDLYRTRRRRGLIVLGTVLMLAGGAGYLGVQHGPGLLRAVLPQWRLVRTWSLGRFEVRLYGDRWYDRPMQVRILHDGRVAFTLTNWALDVGGRDRSGQPVGLGVDITRDGVPDLILSEYSGGAHCCSMYWVLELDPEQGPRPLARVDALHGDALFEDLDGDGVFEVLTQDWTFAYWPTSFAGSPHPDVTLRLRSGRYTLADDLMVRPRPAAAALAELAQRIRADAGWARGGVPPAYYEAILNLIYSGQPGAAWELADAAWPPEADAVPDAAAAAAGLTRKAAFLAELRGYLVRSPYWPDIHGLSGGGE